MAREIERKFRLRKKPPLRQSTGVDIRQGYLLTENGELRVRQSGRKCFVTVKTAGDLDRREWEKRIPRWVFDLLWPHTAGRRVEKRRYQYDLGDATGEVDIYSGRHKGLVILEIEFRSRKKADRFQLPKRMKSAVEVTDERSYKNRSLATSEIPPFPKAKVER